jgi:hypothetical protein
MVNLGAVNVWQLDLQLLVISVHITPNVVSLNPAHCEGDIPLSDKPFITNAYYGIDKKSPVGGKYSKDNVLITNLDIPLSPIGVVCSRRYSEAVY